MTRTVSEIIARLLRSVMTPALLVGRSGSGGSARDNPRATGGFYAFSPLGNDDVPPRFIRIVSCRGEIGGPHIGDEPRYGVRSALQHLLLGGCGGN